MNGQNTDYLNQVVNYDTLANSITTNGSTSHAFSKDDTYIKANLYVVRGFVVNTTGAHEFDMKAGTALTAGKDATGKELIYKTENELVINKAKVKGLKTIFLEKNVVVENNKPVEKINRMYAAPIANSADGNGTPFTVAESAWPALGYFDTAVKDNNVVGKEAEIGFAIASPQLFLAEGQRIITAKFSFTKIPLILKKDFNELTFTIQLTGEKEWVNYNSITPVNIETETLTDATTIQFLELKIIIPNAEQAIVAYDKKIHGEVYQTDLPVIKFIFKDSLKYELLKSVTITAIRLTVDVAGVKNLILENDQTALGTTPIILPFTQTPKKGYSFYVGSKEVFFKALQSLTLSFDKIEEVLVKRTVPSTAAVGDTKTVDDVAQINIAILKDRAWKYIPKNVNKNPYSFGAMQNSFTAKIEILYENDFNNIIKLENDRETNYQNFPSKENSLSGFMKMDLIDEIDSSIIIDNSGNNVSTKVILPKTFIIKNLELAYKSSQPFVSDIEQFFHIYPFGTIETFPIKNSKISFEELDKSKDNLLIETAYLLPQFKFGIDEKKEVNDARTTELEALKKNFFNLYQYEFEVYQQGNLFIGIEDLKPPQNLSLLFKIADGTAQDNDTDPPKINWSYLINNEWRPLPDENIVSDSTYGLQVTGIMLIDFPADATNNNTIISKGLHWLCASVDAAADRIPKIINVIAQANKAVFFDQQNDPNHYKIPLPAGAIAKLSIKVPEVKIIQQPFESFDGKMREEGKVFYARASERLRHKHRAVTPWDYEHLVMQHFPGIYKVKCLTHTDPECICRHPKTNDGIPDTTACCCGQVAPGHVLIVPVSNLRNKAVVDILKPRTGRRTLLQIEEYLKKLTSPFVHVHAKNPKFEEIKTGFSVKFYTGTDKGRYLKQLNDDIIEFLTPWAFDESKEVVFGGSIYASNIINFIEELDYVDYITCFRMIHIVKGCCDKDTLKELTCTDMRKKLEDIIDIVNNTKLSDRCLSLVEATSPQAILTSAKKHCIELIPEPGKTKDCNCS